MAYPASPPKMSATIQSRNPKRRLKRDMSLPELPKLRPVEPMWVEHMGQRFLHLRDPMNMSGELIMIPERVAPIAALLDGTRNLGEIRAGMALRFGAALTEDNARSLVEGLDRALLIENGEYRRAYRRALAEYRAADGRRMSHAGAVYPRDAGELSAQLDGWTRRFAPDAPASKPSGDLAAMVCPHIDYERGHATYAKLWRMAADDLADVELAIILGTDHAGAPAQITPTRQSYATPQGELPTDADALGLLERAVGKSAYDEELHHAREHSIELAAVWLRHFARRADLAALPILCGSFHEFTNGDAHPNDDARMSAALDALGEIARRRRTLIIAAGDLAHVGPAFGDPNPLSAADKSRLREEDAASINAIRAGDSERFLNISRAESDKRRICGLPPIYMALRLAEGAAGADVGYDQCPADARNGSVVSIVGAALYS